MRAYMRSLLFTSLAAMVFIVPASAQQITRPLEHCLKQLPLGTPQGDPMLRLICRRAYLTAADLGARIPAWVAYSIDRDSAVGCEMRHGRFMPDLSIPSQYRADPRDYARSGYDMGHMAPAADMAWDAEVQAESFIMTNIAPQTPNLNRGAWKLLETHVRAWSLEGRRLTVYMGAIWSRDSARIGSGVTVPDQFFKIVADIDSGEHLAFIMPNAQKVPTNLRSHLISVAELEKRSGLTIPVTGDKKHVGNLWPADIRNLAAEKKGECG
jgi:endonuclease G, mitochondrial